MHHTCEVNESSQKRRSVQYYRFMKNILAKGPFVYIEKVFHLWVQCMKNGSENKSVAFIFLFGVQTLMVARFTGILVNMCEENAS